MTANNSQSQKVKVKSRKRWRYCIKDKGQGTAMEYDDTHFIAFINNKVSQKRRSFYLSCVYACMCVCMHSVSTHPQNQYKHFSKAVKMGWDFLQIHD